MVCMELSQLNLANWVQKPPKRPKFLTDMGITVFWCLVKINLRVINVYDLYKILHQKYENQKTSNLIH